MERPEGTGARRGRAAALIGAAAALGVVAGTCAGYLVQAGREPTELPPLSQPVLAQAKGEAPEPLTAAQDRRVKTDGDLRELLLKKPRGARDAEYLRGDDGWLDLDGYAAFHKYPDRAFGALVSDEFRRAAVTGWEVGGTYVVEIRLLQFRQEERLGAVENSEGNQYGADARDDDARTWALPGTRNGRVFVATRPETKPGYRPDYTAKAFAWRGDIAMEVWISDTRPIPKAKIMDLAERQLERL
ncbi:hypothetical protein AB0K80_02660 [Streptomyces sp. NPDC052682]|uniref:hypothetical protein n=1 Tax=Streptomyces sp. NPDC052682 TaxID=3154954 RepID=UPI00341A4642